MEQELGILFRKIINKHRQTSQEYLAHYNLYLGQPRILFMIEREPGMTQKQIVEALSLTKETVSVSLKRLEATGYIERQVSASDRREKRIYLTQQARAVMPELQKNFRVIDNAPFETLSDRDKTRLYTMFQSMLAVLEKGEDHEKIL